MNFASWMIWGFIGTLILTTIMSASQSLGMTRMNIPYLLGTLFTPNRDKAKIIGVFVHLLNGWIFSIIYVFVFEVLKTANWWIGGILGFIHAAFILVVGIPILPGIHPRMANNQQGPTVVKQLEPPGFLALHYGYQTPISIVLAHIIFGMILGGFYSLKT